jgi:hypothetical protein
MDSTLKAAERSPGSNSGCGVECFNPDRSVIGDTWVGLTKSYVEKSEDQ